MEFIYSFISNGMDQRPAYGYSHRLRAAVEKPNITPSPLDYQSLTSLTNKSKGFTFGHRPRTDYVKDYDLPGPGEYYITEDIPVPRPRNLTGYSFGMKTWYKRPLSHSPGPKYNPRESDYSRRKHGFSFGHRSEFYRNIDDIPGPGEYETEKFVYNNTPAYSFGVKNYSGEYSENKNPRTPALSKYQLNEINISKNKKPGFKFGTEKRSRVFKPSNWNPGPGEYNIAKSDFHKAESYYNNKGFSFGLRFPTLIS